MIVRKGFEDFQKLLTDLFPTLGCMLGQGGQEFSQDLEKCKSLEYVCMCVHDLPCGDFNLVTHTLWGLSTLWELTLGPQNVFSG